MSVQCFLRCVEHDGAADINRGELDGNTKRYKNAARGDVPAKLSSGQKGTEGDTIDASKDKGSAMFFP
jgi:hypothetical protein